MTPDWHVYDYWTTHAVLRHRMLTRAALRPQGGQDALAGHVLNLEGARHALVRAALRTAFDRAAAPALPSVRRTVRQVLNCAEGNDLAASFVRPVALLALDRVIGFADGDADALRWWHEAVLSIDAECGPKRRQAIRARMAELVATRRHTPRLDAIALLCADERLTADEAIASLVFAIGAGYVNLANFLGLALLALAEHPDQYGWLRSHPAAVPGAVGELLRFAQPCRRASTRVAAADLEVAGRTIRAGTRVYLHHAEASRDPARYPNSDRLDVRAGRDPGLALGSGRHACLGAGFVRGVADLVLLELVEHVDHVTAHPAQRAGWDFGEPLQLTLIRREPPNGPFAPNERLSINTQLERSTP